MPTINDRIVELIDEFGIKKIQFAERLGISSAYASQLCSGVRTPSDRTISDICREFNIRREWLEAGEGPMKLPEADEDLDYINRLLADDDAETVRFIKKFLRAYNDLSPADQKIIDNLIRTLTNQK
jgi:transcriptional regulator with XRE-family HTH domain